MIALASAEKALLKRYSPRANKNFRTQFIGTDRHQAHGEPDRTALAPVVAMPVGAFRDWLLGQIKA